MASRCAVGRVRWGTAARRAAAGRQQQPEKLASWRRCSPTLAAAAQGIPRDEAPDGRAIPGMRRNRWRRCRRASSHGQEAGRPSTSWPGGQDEGPRLGPASPGTRSWHAWGPVLHAWGPVLQSCHRPREPERWDTGWQRVRQSLKGWDGIAQGACPRATSRGRRAVPNVRRERRNRRTGGDKRCARGRERGRGGSEMWENGGGGGGAERWGALALALGLGLGGRLLAVGGWVRPAAVRGGQHGRPLHWPRTRRRHGTTARHDGTATRHDDTAQHDARHDSTTRPTPPPGCLFGLSAAAGSPWASPRAVVAPGARHGGRGGGGRETRWEHGRKGGEGRGEEPGAARGGLGRLETALALEDNTGKRATHPRHTDVVFRL